MRHRNALIAAACCVPVVLGGQTTTSDPSLQGRSFISLGVGLTGSHQAESSPTGQFASTNGESASFGFTHFIRPSVAVEISTAVLDAAASNSYAKQSTRSVVPLLFGLSYSPSVLALTPTLRPYVSALAGPYFSNVAENSASGATASNDVAPGARLGAGVNWFVARHFVLQLEGDYHAIGRFEHPEQLARKPGGFAMTAGFGFGWGGR